MKKNFLIFLFGMIFISCSMFENSTEEIVTVEKPEIIEEPVVEEPEYSDFDNDTQIIQKDRKWTFLIYMAADNNLETAAIEDLLEMEHATFNTDVISVFALIDRSKNYNTSNDNWSGTRLYKISSGNAAEVNLIQSDWMECSPLGLNVGIDTELDMSSSSVLSTAVEYVFERYPAEHYGLIMWGHGTGWRNEENNLEEDSLYKGFAYDETSGTYMTLFQLGQGLEKSVEKMGSKLNFIGFDTCYGGEIEVAYELKNCTDYVLGSEGLISNSGWNYKKIFESFYENENMTAEELCDSIITQFSDEYFYTSRASIAATKIEKINDFVSAFNDYCLAVSGKINKIAVHDEIMDFIYGGTQCKTEAYTYGKPGYDIYLDVTSLVENLQTYFTSKKNDGDLVELYAIFKNCEAELFYSTWASDRTSGGLGVYFSTLSTGGFLASTHSLSYIKGKTNNQIHFVQDCIGYVPSKDTNLSLLDKLFYTRFN